MLFVVFQFTFNILSAFYALDIGIRAVQLSLRQASQADESSAKVTAWLLQIRFRNSEAFLPKKHHMKVSMFDRVLLQTAR